MGCATVFGVSTGTDSGTLAKSGFNAVYTSLAPAAPVNANAIAVPGPGTKAATAAPPSNAAPI